MGTGETPRVASEGGHNTFSVQPVFVLGLAPTQVQDPALALWNFMRLIRVDFSCMSRSLWRMSLPSSTLTGSAQGHWQTC